MNAPPHPLERLSKLIQATNYELRDRITAASELDRHYTGVALDMDALARRTAAQVTIALLQVRRDSLTDAYNIFSGHNDATSAPVAEVDTVTPDG